MKKLNLYLAAMTLCVMGVNAQKQDGSISDKMLERIRESYQGTPEQKAVKNALASNSIGQQQKDAVKIYEYSTMFLGAKSTLKLLKNICLRSIRR